MYLDDMNVQELKAYILGLYAIPLEDFIREDRRNLIDARNLLQAQGIDTIFIRDGHIRFYNRKEQEIQ